jgi:hypothetical protein
MAMILGKWLLAIVVVVIATEGGPASRAADRADSRSSGPCSPAAPGDSKASGCGDEDSETTQSANRAPWLDYQRSVAETLGRSSLPRDQALVALTGVIKFNVDNYANGQRESSRALLRAARAAPDDALVQWIALVQSNGVEKADSDDAPLRNLRRLEPDNAAVLIFVVTDAVKRNDSAAIDSALSKMAAGTKFDGHFAQLESALVEAYRSVPIPQSSLDEVREEDRHDAADVVATTSAFAVAAAVGLPPFQPLVNACRVNSSAQGIGRSGDCAAIGRLLMALGDSVLANMIGPALLRVSHTITDDDTRVARENDWVYERYGQLVSRSEDHDSIARAHTFLQDWSESGREMEAMRRAIARMGDAPTPPDDWVDKHAPFSDERRIADEKYLLEHVGK